MKIFRVNIQWATKRSGVSMHQTIEAKTRGDAIELALKTNIDRFPARVLRGIMIKEVTP